MRLLPLFSSIITVAASVSADSKVPSHTLSLDSSPSIEKANEQSHEATTFIGTNKQYDASKTEASPLLKEDDFVIFYAFSGEKLESPLKETMIKHFEKLGTVYLADDSKLTEKQKKEKYRIGGGMLQVIATPIIEEKSSLLVSDYKILPVLELSLKVIGGVESLSNESKFCCPIWENKKFIGTNIDNEVLVQKAVTSLGIVLDAFIADYQVANPGKKPQFFLFH